MCFFLHFFTSFGLLYTVLLGLSLVVSVFRSFSITFVLFMDFIDFVVDATRKQYGFISGFMLISCFSP